MKCFLIEYKEISYGVVEVFAKNEEEARNIADSEGMRYTAKSEMQLGAIQEVEDIDNDY